MRTVNFAEAIVFPILDRQGYDPVLDLFQDYANALDRFVNAWVRKCWDFADWPELSLIEARTVTDNLVPYDDPTPMGKILKVYLVDPQLHDGPFDIPFRLYPTAIHIGYDHGRQVWVKFMTRPNVYTLKPYDITFTYGLNEVVYDPFSGNDYKSLQATNTGQNLTDPAWWSVVPFPYVFATVVMRGAYSDALRNEGQSAKAQGEEQAAMLELQIAEKANLGSRYDTLTDQQTGVPRSLTSPVIGTSATASGATK